MRRDDLCVAAIRSTVIDGINKANSGHPGMSIGSAPILYTLFTKHLIADPKHPNWINRDRFVMSAGHGCSILYSTLNAMGYDISVNDLKDFRKFAQLHYVYDCITDYWRINRQVSDLQRDLNDAVKRNKYWSAITMAQWEKGIDDLISAQSSVSKTIPQKNKLFIDFLMKMKLKEKPQYFVHFMNTDEEDSGFLDFEHIIPKKIIQTHIKDLSVSQQNLFSVSSIGNLCYLTVTDNRAKREKTIYEFKENRPSYSYDMDYLSFIEYPAEDDIVFMKYPNIEFRQGYERFINNRMEKLRVEFLRLIRKTYFEHQ